MKFNPGDIVVVKISGEPVMVVGNGGAQIFDPSGVVLGPTYQVRRFHPDNYHIELLSEAELETKAEEAQRRYEEFNATQEAIFPKGKASPVTLEATPPDLLAN